MRAFDVWESAEDWQLDLGTHLLLSWGGEVKALATTYDYELDERLNTLRDGKLAFRYDTTPSRSGRSLTIRGPC